MSSAFPGQIPPDRRLGADHSDTPHQHVQSSWQAQLREPNASKNAAAALGIRPLSELTESNACKLVEAATSGWRYSPYRHVSKSERTTPSPKPQNFDQSLVMRSRLSSAAKSTFLHHVLKHKERISPTVEVKKEPLAVNEQYHEVDRRMELLDQTFRSYGKRYPLLDYSPPPSPPQPAIPPQMMTLGMILNDFQF